MSIDHLSASTPAAPATGTSRADESSPASMSDFVSRHVGPDATDTEQMLSVIGQPSLDAMCDRAIPGAIRSESPLRVGAAASESAVIDELRAFASRNTVLTSLIGLGYYGTVTPPVVRRNVLENPAWYTAYTPYQPEISQGRLEALLNFQTVVTDLTGLDVAGSSLLDEATAAAEAMSLMRRVSKAPAEAVVLLDERLFPQTTAVMRTRAEAIGLPLAVADLREVTDEASLAAAADGRAVVGVMVQYPDATGELVDWAPLTAAAHAAGALVTACADLLALTIVTEPAAWGADIAVGSAQRFGVPMGFGGPHAGYMAVHRGLERQLPGRSSASRSTPRATRPTASPSRRGSSTSAVRRRRPTSAPPRCSSPSWPACMPCGTAPPASRASRAAWPVSPPSCAAPLSRVVSTSGPQASSTP